MIVDDPKSGDYSDLSHTGPEPIFDSGGTGDRPMVVVSIKYVAAKTLHYQQAYVAKPKQPSWAKFQNDFKQRKNRR